MRTCANHGDPLIHDAESMCWYCPTCDNESEASMKPFEKAKKMKEALEQLGNEYAEEGRPDVAHVAHNAAEHLGPSSLARLYEIVMGDA